MDSKKKRPLIVLTGPTAAGKTSLSLGLAAAVGGEIISADSMQVYRGMDIGSAKIKKEEMRGIPHHLLDILDPSEDFDIVRFQALAKEAMAGIYERGHIPILTGGTGFYIQAVTRDIDFSPSHKDGSLRESIAEKARDQEEGFLHRWLVQVDPQSAELIHENNEKRIIRALEFYYENGYPISEHNAREKEKESPYNLAYFALTVERELLYRRIDERVDKMMEEGLLEEVRSLKARGCRRGMVSMQGLGYKEMLDYLDGCYSLEEAVRVLKRDTRHFAKRQMTWFNREKDICWLKKEEFDFDEEKILGYMLDVLREKDIYR